MPIRPDLVRFGLFEVDLTEGVLIKNGHRIKLQEQPFRILAILLEHPGETVSREQLRQALWTADTFVDFDRGLNAAVAKLRQALGDSADNPRFI
jgi:DNA-binding winged helix-turn-helix (wHTH) protein